MQVFETPQALTNVSEMAVEQLLLLPTRLKIDICPETKQLYAWMYLISISWRVVPLTYTYSKPNNSSKKQHWVCLLVWDWVVWTQTSFKITMYLKMTLNFNPPVSTSQVLKLQEYTSTPAFMQCSGWTRRPQAWYSSLSEPLPPASGF